MDSQAHPVLPGLQAAAGVHTGLAVLAVEQFTDNRRCRCCLESTQLLSQ
jgi:hypothetical protein